MAQNVISLTEAQNWAKLYRKGNPNGVIAYLIPELDITQILSQNGVFNIRAYLGFDPVSQMSKLMLVGVDADGNDLIDAEAGYFIYDFTKPCPSTCDVNSPLFNLK